MTGLATTLLSRACRTFLRLAYPGGEETIPCPKNTFLHLNPDQPLDEVLLPTLCQTLRGEDAGFRGYALRLGSADYPHLKLQVVRHEGGNTWVFAVDTHDRLLLEPGHPDKQRLEQLQECNRRLKAEIERAWEAEGITTFNSLLRNALSRQA
jgi:hypothetical protein